ncbi:MAG: hypothetical protein IJ682_04750 [Lachnospiraceae bacterium]|nr:hypothetical protein [Lachnospiraceae bacterium]
MRERQEKQMIIHGMRNELDRIRSLPPDEAREDARNNLQAIGVIDQDGNVAEVYSGVFVNAQ